jgi:hypothetical protein
MAQSKRNTWLGIIAAILIAFAGYRLFFGASQRVDLPDTFTGHGVCLACEEESLIVYQKGEREPFPCEACGQRSVYAWWFCDDCRHRFVPELVRQPDEPPRPTPFPYCTRCGCRGVAGWEPDNPYMAPEGDAELPKWP